MKEKKQLERRKDSKNRVLKDGEYERENGTFEYRWRDARGKQHSRYAKELNELREIEAEVQRDILNGKKKVNKNMTLNDVFYRWEQVKRGLKRNTFENYKYMYRMFVEPNFGKSRICELRKSDVRAFYNYLHDVRNLQPNTIDSVHTVLHQVFEFAADDEIILANPSTNALKELKKSYSRETGRKHGLTASQQRIFEHFLETNPKYKHWHPIFTLMLYTGLRVGECTGLQWSDIDFDNGTISINQTLVYFASEDDEVSNGKRSSHFVVHSPKTIASERTLPLLPKAMEALKEERALQQQKIHPHCTAKIPDETKHRIYDNFFFSNRYASVHHQNTLNKALKRIICACNFEQIDKGEETIPVISCHILRHSFATRLAEADVNPKTAQMLLGHSDFETTMNIYTDATKKMANKGAKTLDIYFQKMMNGEYDGEDDEDE